MDAHDTLSDATLTVTHPTMAHPVHARPIASIRPAPSPHPEGRARRPCILQGLGLMLSCLLLAACTSKPEPHQEQPRPVLSETLTPAPLHATWTLAGDVRARTESTHAFQTGGRVLERRVDVGDRVQRGQVLARIDPVDLRPLVNARRAEQAAARSQLQLAQTDLERAEKLHARKFVSSANVDRARAAVDVARAKLDAASAQLRKASNAYGYHDLASDVSGVVTAVQVEPGQVVAAGQPVLRVAREGDVEVAVAIPESDLARARAVQQWTVSFAGLPGQQWQARLRELSPAADPASRTYGARLTLQGDTRAVALGMSATAHPVVQAGEVLSVPLSALYTRDDTPRVWVIDTASHTVHTRAVKLGATSGNRIVVPQGLQPGEQVIIAGANLLREGQKVRLPQSAATGGEGH